MGILDLLFPKRCVSCGKLGNYVCFKCFQKIEFISFQICPYCGRSAIDGKTHPRCKRSWGLDGLYFNTRYKGPVKDAVHKLKYRLVTDLARFWIDILYQEKPKALPNFDYLVPVPLHPKRERERGFNQSEIIAKILGKKWTIPVSRNIIKRIRHTRPQVELERKERKTNLLEIGRASCRERV